MVLTAEGRIFGWGRGSFGRLGTGLEKDCYSPIEVFLPGLPILLLTIDRTDTLAAHTLRPYLFAAHTLCCAYPCCPNPLLPILLLPFHHTHDRAAN